jgi:hypothetical protein
MSCLAAAKYSKRVLDITLCDKVCQCFSPFSSNNKTDHHDITEILLTGIKHHKIMTLQSTFVLITTIQFGDQHHTY